MNAENDGLIKFNRIRNVKSTVCIWLDMAVKKWPGQWGKNCFIDMIWHIPHTNEVWMYFFSVLSFDIFFYVVWCAKSVAISRATLCILSTSNTYTYFSIVFVFSCVIRLRTPQINTGIEFKSDPLILCLLLKCKPSPFNINTIPFVYWMRLNSNLAGKNSKLN